MSRDETTGATQEAAAGLAAWDLLADRLGGGAFVARARGLLGAEFALLDATGEGEEFGRLRMLGLTGAELSAGDGLVEAVVQRQGLYGARYRMTTGGSQVLIAGPERPPEPLRVFCGGRPYAVESSVLRNRATARPLVPSGADAADGGASAEVRLRGGLSGRAYRAEFRAGDGGALAVAAFLLYRAVALRRQAY